MIRVLCVSSLFLLALASWNYWHQEPFPAVTVDQPERLLDLGKFRDEKILYFRLDNRARHPVRVVGLANC
jgi:hypothetical protein